MNVSIGKDERIISVCPEQQARTNLEQETESSFGFTCTREDLEYWLSGTAPVLLVVSKPKQKLAWWVSVKDYFSSSGAQAISRKIKFDKQSMKFDESSASDLINAAFEWSRLWGLFPARHQSMRY